MSANAEEIEHSLSKRVREKLGSKEPTPDEKDDLLAKHQHHLVRRTTSVFSMTPNVCEGIEAETTAHVPDMFCFDCDEWVGLSGVDLRGKPRSKAEAFYLGGEPPEIRYAREMTGGSIDSLAENITNTVESVEVLNRLTRGRATWPTARLIQLVSTRHKTDEKIRSMSAGNTGSCYTRRSRSQRH